MAIVANSFITYTPEGAVSISYNTLVSSPLSLTSSIGGQEYCLEPRAQVDSCAEKAFGSHPDSLGIVIVRDLPPNYAPARERLLRLAYRFASLDPKVRERYADPKSRYR